jgi:adenosine deaminase
VYDQNLKKQEPKSNYMDVIPDTLEQFVNKIPKVELHLHLEGAIPLQTLFGLVQGKDLSINTLDDLQKRFTYTDFEHFIETWIWKNAFITDEKDFEDIVYQVLLNLNNQNVRYVEAFYSPSDFQAQGLSTQEITAYLIKGKQKAYSDCGIQCELIMDIVRGDGPDVGMQRLEEVTPYVGKGVIGIGLGGSEQKFPADPYAPVYKEAKDRGFRLTAHAGEAAGAPSIWAALEKLGCERIGHGLRAHEDPALLSLLKEKQIPLEMCVISNIRTGVCESVDVHPVKDYFQQGLLVTINSDDPTMFDTCITREYMVLVEHLGFSVDDLRHISMNGITASFMSDKDKEVMMSHFEREWQYLSEEVP